MDRNIPLLHVVRRLRVLVRDWWGLELVFTDAAGQFTPESAPPAPSICAALFAGDSGLARCAAAEGALAREAVAAREFRSTVCFAGMRRIAVPVIIDGEVAGAVVAAGYRREFPDGIECASVVEALRPLGLSEERLYEAWESLRLIDDRDERYLVTLIQVVIDEVTAYERELAERSRRVQLPAADFETFTGSGLALRGVLATAAAVAASDASILITGESGTGKERLAEAIHAKSLRAGRPFVALNCGAFQDLLLESELFGHVRGSFTGAVRDKRGLVEQAHGGTLFLDEVGEMSAAMQVKVLRVLQEGVFYPVGAVEPKQVNVRVMAATHRALESLVKTGAFRDDLYYRLNVIRLALPPLRERVDDIAMLAEGFLAKRARGGTPRRLHPATLARLRAYAWPGNVRELENEIERLVALAGTADVLPPALLSERIRDPQLEAAGDGSLEQAVERLESELIAGGLRRLQWNKTRLARELGMSRTTLLQKIAKYGLERRRKPRRAA